MRLPDDVKASWLAMYRDFLVTSQAWGRSTNRSNQLAESLWPISIEYYSTLRPVFLEAWKNLDLKSRGGTWLIRDGMTAVASYFANQPFPEPGFRGHILVHESVVPCVPGAWRNFSGVYRLENSDLDKLSRLPVPGQILLCSSMREDYCSLGTLDAQLDRLVSRLGARCLARAELLCCFQENRTVEKRKSSFETRFTGLVKSKLRRSPRSISWEELVVTDSFSAVGVTEFNEYRLFSDSALLHLTMSRGARLIDVSQSASPAGGSFEALSPNHGYRFWSRLADYQRGRQLSG